MKSVFLTELGPFLGAVAGVMDLYVPKKAGEHYVFARYDPEAAGPVEFNPIRTCVPVKEFLFPLRELAASTAASDKPPEVKPFAVFGLKDCDLRSLEVLDRVFAEEEFLDPFYTSRRQAMFVITADCTEAGESCFCNVFDGKPFAEKGFDLNLSPVEGGFIVESGSDRGAEFLDGHKGLFGDVPQKAVAQRDENRRKVRAELEAGNELKAGMSLRDAVEQGQESEVFDEEAAGCIECQACTRVCPTCHCFYLYDSKQKDYFTKTRIWDSCMRLGYAAVAGGANPRKILGDRMRHRMLHKFVYFLDRYGLQMCIGCGRCVDADAGGTDIRRILLRLSQEVKNKGRKTAESAK
jgi:ferredoxin